jgi:hypothetical protein
MGAQVVVLTFAIGCAVVLLFAPVSQRTIWVSGAPPNWSGPGMRHSAGWDWVAPLCALVALGGLLGGWAMRPRVVLAALGAAVATVAFGIAAGAVGFHYRDAITGVLDEPRFVTIPPAAAPFFAVIATLGAGYALALAVGWLAPDSSSP